MLDLYVWLCDMTATDKILSPGWRPTHIPDY
jgi:hypothetical protein